MAIIVNEQGRVLPKVRDGILVRRLCGAALEMCFLALVRSLGLPERYRFKDDADVWRWRDDVDILENMWTLATRVKELLNVRGWTLQYAQSTYRSLQEACEKEPEGKTRSQSSFSVDLTVVRGKFTFWWELQFADSNNLSWSTCAAFVKLRTYELACNDPMAW